jgi:hypothetical protein
MKRASRARTIAARERRETNDGARKGEDGLSSLSGLWGVSGLFRSANQMNQRNQTNHMNKNEQNSRAGRVRMALLTSAGNDLTDWGIRRIVRYGRRVCGTVLRVC